MGLSAITSGDGPTLVLVHGFTQSARSWRRVEPHLPAGYRRVAIDLPGHGGSSEVAVAHLDEAARLVGERGGRATYVGYSLGGRTCLRLALTSPALVQRLVLVGATAGLGDDAERARRRAADEALASELEAGGDAGVEGFLERWLAGPLFAHLSPEQADLPARRDNRAAGLAASLRTCGTGTQPPSWEVLGQLAMPVLVVAGERDERFAALGRAMVEAIGDNARLALIQGAGHAACFEAPERFGALLGEFLAEPAR
ncbi:MAG: alpha/beta fold hydrolase [Actinomycetota bacterium]|nr:alpha/beta fold hydrolase [Actinomycetota bacterium]